MSTSTQQSNPNETTICTTKTTATTTITTNAIGANGSQTSENTPDYSSSNVSNPAWLNSIDGTKSNTLDIQKQRLGHLIGLISNQETKLNRLTALRKLVKEQTIINVELTNELKTVNNSISEKDGELRQALNRVDNLNRQLNNYRRTRAYRNSKNVAAGKQRTCNHDMNNVNNVMFGENLSDNESSIQQKKTDQYEPSANGHTITETNDANTKDSSPNKLSFSLIVPEASIKTPIADDNKGTSSDSSCASEQAVIPGQQDLKQINSANDKKDDYQANSSAETANRMVSSPSSFAYHVQNHPSPAINKYTNARQKLIGSGMKNNGRRVSFDPLALLLDAALEGELDLVIQTSKQVPDLSASHDECVTALHNAVVAGHYEVAKYLIESGCDINIQDSDGWTPLHCAASCNNLQLVKLLIENGALIYATTTTDYSTPAMKCEQTEEGFEDCYKYLMYVQNNLGVINNGIVYVLYDYEAQEEDELSFTTDEELIVLRRDDSQEQEWWWAQKRIQQPSDTVVDIKEGYIPRNLVGLYPRVKAFKKANNPTSKSIHGDDVSK